MSPEDRHSVKHVRGHLSNWCWHRRFFPVPDKKPPFIAIQVPRSIKWLHNTAGKRKRKPPSASVPPVDKTDWYKGVTCIWVVKKIQDTCSGQTTPEDDGDEAKMSCSAAVSRCSTRRCFPLWVCRYRYLLISGYYVSFCFCFVGLSAMSNNSIIK